MADAALARRLISVEELRAARERQAQWINSRRMSSALRLVDGRRESWLESRSVVTLVGLGLPIPQAQVEIRDPSGRFVARVDFLWTERGVVGEADGVTKYALDNPLEDLRRDSADRIRQQLIAEKRREDRLRALGFEVVRWGWHDLVTAGDQVAANIRAAFQRARPSRITADLRIGPRLWVAGL